MGLGVELRGYLRDVAQVVFRSRISENAGRGRHGGSTQVDGGVVRNVAQKKNALARGLDTCLL